jgi:kynurenine formamidase
VEGATMRMAMRQGGSSGRRVVSICVLALAAGTVSASEAPLRPAAPVTVEQFDLWMAEISNWGRWGDADELGTLNLITPDKRIAAARLVRDGVSVSLALPLNKIADELNTNPFQHELETATFGGHEVAGDRYAVQYHGFAHSHMDGLPHFIYKGNMYNGVPASVLKPTGAERLGIHNAFEGVFTRGVLVDMPRFKGVDYLAPGTAITIEDLEGWEKQSGLRVGSGDVLLVRTGRWARLRDKGPWNFLEGAAGMHASVATWLKARDVAVIGCDGVSDVMPSNADGRVNPLHELVLVGLGMPILDNLDLDAVASEALRRGRNEFLYVGAPLRVTGGTGSPLNPLAVF